MKKRQYLSPDCCNVLIITGSALLVGSPTGENYDDIGNYGGFSAPRQDMLDVMI